ncbi:unnamed protein product [Hydatigera taeniaeformis]|uniref:Kinesin motor domain-containing protein n=1 Tax=Hydatigena taeniaeformis TaxID=6205 RepID=A0A0R3WP69_HYDTA|nr:unnamed protein product [Hydatigera taeniaeformis]
MSSDALSFTPLRERSLGLHPSFNFATLNRNLLDEFNERESNVLRKDEQMPVYLRIRPLNPGEASDKVLFARDATRVVLKPLVEEKGLRAGMFAFGQSSHEFTFSRVFDEVTTQAEIFKAVAAERVSEFLEGVNGLVFAYGTTSSGKTYSLQGTAGNGGVIPRALECIFRSAVLNPTERLVPRGFDEVQEVTEVEAARRRQDKALLLRLARTTENVRRASLFVDILIFAPRLLTRSSFPWQLSRSRAVSWESVRPSSETGLSTSTKGEAVARVREECLEVSFAYKDSAAFCFWISFVEIYNEVVYDLLDPDFVSAIEKHSRASSGVTAGCGGGGGPFGVRRTPLDLRTDKRGNVFVKGVRWYAVTSAEEAYSLISIGRCCQCVGVTRLNESSSRSHTILTLRALRSRRGTSVGGEMGAVGSSSLLSFCDLAGSERCTKAATLAQVQRLREANSINTSLLTLGKCIEALRHNQRHGGGGGNPRIVPYRESRLTRLFQNFFVAAGPAACGRGRSRACLLVNAAPCASLAEETLHSLRFSALAAQVLMSAAAPPPLSSPKASSPEYTAAAIASTAIQDQLRAQLLRQGFQLRCSGSLLGRHGKSSISSIATLATAASAEMTMVGAEESEATPTVAQHLVGDVSCGSDGHGGGGGVRRPLADWMDETVEAELRRLSRGGLVEMVHELVAAVAEALPAEVEAARSEARAEVTATMGEELLRMEEQYEVLLQKQEREFETRLAKEHRKRKQEQQRRGQHQQSGCGISGADCSWLPLLSATEGEEEVEVERAVSEVGRLEVVEGSELWAREPSAKTRRMGGRGDELEGAVEAKSNAESEEECPSCDHYAKEVARLREELEEARGDLADQQDAIAGVMAQRDAFEVEVRRLEFQLQLALVCFFVVWMWPLEENCAKPVSATTNSAAASLFPPLLGAEAVAKGNESVVVPFSLSAEEGAMFKKQKEQLRLKERSLRGAGDAALFPPLISPSDRVCVNGDIDVEADVDIIPPTPVTVVKVGVERRGAAEGEVGGGGECVEVEESASGVGGQCAGGREVLSAVTDVRVDVESTAIPRGSGEMNGEVVRNGYKSKTSDARMASFLAHEAEAEAAADVAAASVVVDAIAKESALESRCEALSRDLSVARSTHEEAMAQLAELQRRVHEYEELASQYCVRRLCWRVCAVLVVRNGTGCGL